MKLLPLLAFFGIFGLTGCSDMCGNEVSQTVASPSGALKAVVFSRNCGATTGFNTQVSVLHANKELPPEGGNTFIGNGSASLVVRWENESSLKIAGGGAASPIKQNTQVAGVAVAYGN